MISPATAAHHQHQAALDSRRPPSPGRSAVAQWATGALRRSPRAAYAKGPRPANLHFTCRSLRWAEIQAWRTMGSLQRRRSATFKRICAVLSGSRSLKRALRLCRQKVFVLCGNSTSCHSRLALMGPSSKCCSTVEGVVLSGSLFFLGGARCKIASAPYRSLEIQFFGGCDSKTGGRRAFSLPFRRS